MNRFAVFVDGSNNYWATRGIGYQMDFTKLLDYYNKDGQVLSAKYFTALPLRDKQTTLHQLVDWLDYNNWNVIQKPMKEYKDDEGKMKRKGNMDIEICVHAFKIAPYITDFVLLSGDGDFRILVESLQDKGIRVHAVSVRELIADELRRQCNTFLDLNSPEARRILDRDAPPMGRSVLQTIRRG